MSIILMNPQNGEILAMVNVPEFNLNEPFMNLECGGYRLAYLVPGYVDGTRDVGCRKAESSESDVEKRLYQ